MNSHIENTCNVRLNCWIFLGVPVKSDVQEMQDVINELRNEHQKLIQELNKLVEDQKKTILPLQPMMPSTKQAPKKKASKPKPKVKKA